MFLRKPCGNSRFLYYHLRKITYLLCFSKAEHWRIQRDLEAGIPVWKAKLGAQKSFLVQYILTLPVLCISESCIEIKINLNFYFYTFCDASKVAAVLDPPLVTTRAKGLTCSLEIITGPWQKIHCSDIFNCSFKIVWSVNTSWRGKIPYLRTPTSACFFFFIEYLRTLLLILVVLYNKLFISSYQSKIYNKLI